MSATARSQCVSSAPSDLKTQLHKYVSLQEASEPLDLHNYTEFLTYLIEGLCEAFHRRRFQLGHIHVLLDEIRSYICKLLTKKPIKPESKFRSYNPCPINVPTKISICKRKVEHIARAYLILLEVTRSESGNVF